MTHTIPKLTFLFSLLLLFGCKNNPKVQTASKLTIFHAGSLSVPFKELADSFKIEHPELNPMMESTGSVDAARKITDLDKNCDLIAVADYLVIENLLIPDHTDWQYGFASNEMVIAYSDGSKNAGKITADNWYQLIQEEGAFIGRSDPNADPCGYRTIFMFKLAEKYYDLPGLAEKLTVLDNTVIRPKEVDLLSLLHSGNIDYLFIYKSVAIQHQLSFVELPDELNLSDPELEDWYSQVSVKVRGKKPGDLTEIQGSSILYSFTIPENAENPDGALEFIRFITDPEKGGKILQKNGMKTIQFFDPRYQKVAPDFAPLKK
jgi:molybdate/tungstate transport system substrate-binding protein